MTPRFLPSPLDGALSSVDRRRSHGLQASGGKPPCEPGLIALLIALVGMMAQILIRQLDERVVAILREQARSRGVSLEQSLRELLTAAARQHSDVRQRLAELRRETPLLGRQLQVDILIREGRDER